MYTRTRNPPWGRPAQSLLAALVLLVSSAGRAAPPEAPPAPFQPQIDDPMLAPVPRAAKEVASWQEARSMMFARSTELRTAEAGVERAEGRWRQSLSALLPNVRASAGVGYDLLNPATPALAAAGAASAASILSTGVKATTPAAAASATLTQSIIDVGAWRGLSSSAAGERSAEANLADVRRRVIQGLARSLVAVVAAERAAELNRLGLRQALERAALTERTFQLGAATQLDVIRVRQDVAVARAALISGDEQLRRTREALGLALGTDTEVGVTRGFALDGLVEETRQTCHRVEGIEQRADVVSANEQVMAARESTRQASAGYLPSLSLSSGVSALTTSEQTPTPGVSARFATWSIGAVLSVPLWEGGFRGGLVRERAGIEKQSEQAAEGLRRSVAVEVMRARRAEEVAKALEASAREARDLAQKTDELTRKSFEIGRATSLELVQSAAVLRQAELTLALREFEWVQARLDAFLTEAQCEG